MTMYSIQQIIQYLGLQLLPGEGGLYRQTYRSEEEIPAVGLPARYREPGDALGVAQGNAQKPFGTAILYLLTNEPADGDLATGTLVTGDLANGNLATGDIANGDLIYGNLAAFSAFHRLKTDEIFHFYLGDPLEMILLFPDGSSRQVILGQDLLNGQLVQFVAPRGAWQGTRLQPGGRFALIGTTMAPGFTIEDYEQGDRAALLAEYPHEREHILALTR